MKKFNLHHFLRSALAFFLIVNVSAGAARAAFEDLGVGARAPGMADAFVAAADDANALYYNPAGLIQVGERQISAQYGQLNRGLTDGSNLNATYFGYTQPLDHGYKGTLGLGYHNFQASNLFTERQLFLSYGWRLKLDQFGWGGIPSAGVTLKQLHRQFQADRFTENSLNDVGSGTGQADPLFAKGYANDKYAFDLGGLYQFGRNYDKSVGLVVMNANQPDVSIGGDGDKPPLITKLGFAYRPTWGLVTAEVRQAKRIQGQQDVDYAFGGERKFTLSDINSIALRGGYAQGSRGLQTITAGASWLISMIQLDYAFNFPIGNLSNTQGSQRVGLSVHLGVPAGNVLSTEESDKADLLLSFAHDSTAVHLIARRDSIDKNLPTAKRALLLRLAMRRFAEDDPGMIEIRKDLASLIKNSDEFLMDWPQLKYAMTNGVSAEGKLNVEQALENYAKGDAKGALARLALIDASSRRDVLVQGLSMLALAELSAQTFRANAIDACIDQVRQIVEALPQDAVIEKGYRELLVRRTREPKALSVTPESQMEAPQTLVAPTRQPEKATDAELAQKSYGTALGYYFTRKSQGASALEREALLNQMKTVYGQSGLDLSLIDRELSQIASDRERAAHPTAVPAPAQTQPATATPPPTTSEPVAAPAQPVAPVQPVAVPAAAPAAAPVAPAVNVVAPVERVAPAVHKAKPAVPAVAAPRPAKKPSRPAKKKTVKAAVVPETPKTAPVPALPAGPASEASRDWKFYQQAVDRGLTDREKLEILKSMTPQNSAEAARISKEIERIKKRIE